MEQFLKNQFINKYKYLIVILCVFFIIELLWIIISPIYPPFSTPDAITRFTTIQNYVKGVKTPLIGEPSPLYYFITSNVDKLFIHTRIYSQFKILEILSALFSIITLVFTYLIFKLIFNNDEKIAVTGTLITALLPMFSYIGMAIDMDALLFAIYTAFIYYSLKLLKNKLNIKDFIILTLLLILGLLTKQNMYINIPIYIGLILYVLYKNNLIKKYIKYLLILFIFMIIIAILLHSGVNTVVIPSIHELFFKKNNYSLLDYIYTSSAKYFSYKGVVFTSFWGDFGYMNEFLKPTAIYSVINIFMYIITFGLVINIFNKIKSKKHKGL